MDFPNVKTTLVLIIASIALIAAYAAGAIVESGNAKKMCRSICQKQGWDTGDSSGAKCTCATTSMQTKEM